MTVPRRVRLLAATAYAGRGSPACRRFLVNGDALFFPEARSTRNHARRNAGRQLFPMLHRRFAAENPLESGLIDELGIRTISSPVTVCWADRSAALLRRHQCSVASAARVDIHERVAGPMEDAGAREIVVQGEVLRVIREHDGPPLSPTTSCRGRKYLDPDGGRRASFQDMPPAVHIVGSNLQDSAYYVSG